MSLSITARPIGLVPGDRARGALYGGIPKGSIRQTIALALENLRTISRARFNIALSRLDASERELAIERLQRPPGAAGVMPPPGTRQLDPDVQARLIEYLRQAQRPADEDALLEHAAMVGMAGAQQ